MTSHHAPKSQVSKPLSETFAALAKDGRKALAPFVTAGDPDLDTTLAVLEALDRAGAAICELGVPYSDPIADGPVIQASYTRALAAGFTLEKFFAMVRKATGRVSMPILAMVSYSIIYRRGIDRFVDDAAAAGLVGLVVPDLPLEESDVLDATCKGANLALVRLVTPTTPPERAAEIARRSTGFLYCVSVAGVTGARTDLPTGLVERVTWLRTKTDVPVLVGFGVSTPEQVKLLSSVADGTIVGSALVRRVGELSSQGTAAISAGVESYVAELVKAAR
ncbi:MAG: tryptophan synthase subunit alpha [Planctomycetota bacterium]|jgi:tryptophan synthase alpha chain|nr:tryptophan synthase subunit alpha [Planctomycetota bacterium]